MSLLAALGLQVSGEQLATLTRALEPPKKASGRKRSASQSDAEGRRGAPAPDVEQARFEARWAQVGPAIDERARKVADRAWGIIPDGDFGAATSQFDAAQQRLRKARDEGNFDEANRQLTLAEAKAKEADAAYPAQNDKSRVTYEQGKATHQATLARYDAAIAGHAFGQPPRGNFAELVAGSQKHRGNMTQGEASGNYLQAIKGLQGLQTFVKAMEVYGRPVKEQWAKVEPVATALIDNAAGFPGLDPKPLRAAVTAAATVMKTVDADDRWGAAHDAVEAVQPLFDAFRKAAVQALAGGGGKAKAARKQAMTILKKDPGLLKSVQAEPGGKEALDAMVKDLGGAAKSADDKDFMKAAIEARFGSKVTGDLTTKYLPRLYNALGMVPESHTKDNEKLTEINRTRVKLLPEGEYSFDADKKKGLINLTTPKTGAVDWLQSKAMAMGVKKLVGQMGGKDISTFDALTLHEVGHAVDEQKAFMKGKAGNVLYGGWHDHTVAEVARVVGDGRGFFKDFPKLPRPFLEAYLMAVLQKQPPDKTSEAGALGKDVKVDWKALARHPATDVAEHIRMKGDGGLWDKGDSGAATYAIGSSVFQQAYENQWVSYALSARGQKLCNYQFRSEAEWFAEPYAAFFLGKLKPNHPLYKMLKEDQDAAKAAQKAAK